MKLSSRTLLSPLLAPRVAASPSSAAATAAGQLLLRRAVNGRAGQPLDLNRYDRGGLEIPVPPTASHEEAEVMGRIKPLPDGQKLQPRPVPTSTADFNKSRVAYSKSVSALRTEYGTEWSERKRREASAAAQYRAGVAAARAESVAARAGKRAASVAEEAARVKERAEVRAASRAVKVAGEVARQAKVDALRRKWLDALTADSTRWVGPEQIDTLITPQLFGLKYAWQYERWFEVKERKRQLREEARRNRRPGQPLREVMLVDGDAEYASDWESEGEEDVGLGSSRHAAKVADAVADSSGGAAGAQATALAVARRMARERGAHFPEPAYDADGRPLPTAADAESFATGSGGEGSIGLLELYHGKRVQDVLQEYEKYMEGAAKELGMAPTATTTASPASSSSSSSSAVVDDGERGAENAYIDICVRAGNVEGLFYALLRKRDRLVKTVVVDKRMHAEPALERFARDWGTWLGQVGAVAGGVFDSRPLQDGGSGADPNAQVLGEYMARVGVSGGKAEVDAATAAASDEAAAARGGSGRRSGSSSASSSPSGTIPKTENGVAMGSADFDDRNLAGLTSAASQVPLPKAK